MPTLAAWLHDVDPFAFRISGDLGLRWYGLAYIGGFIFAWAALAWMAKRRWIALSPSAAGDVVLTSMIGVIVGGRLGYVLFYRPSLLMDFGGGAPWWGLLRINEGGMASHGGMIGLLVAAAIAARHAKVPRLHVVDCLAFVAPVGLFLGRAANFVNGELLGRIAARPGEPAGWWLVKFPQELTERRDELLPLLSDPERDRLTALIAEAAAASPGQPPIIADMDPAALARAASAGFPDASPAMADLFREAVFARADALVAAVQSGAPGFAERLEPLLTARHASQLYQAVAEGPIVLAAMLLVWRRPRRPGVVTATFMMVYGAGRILTEFVRLPDAHFTAAARIAGLSRGQWLSVGLVVAGAALLWWVIKRSTAAPMGGVSGGAARGGPPQPSERPATPREASTR